MSFLHLPIEIRLAVYSELFGEGIARVNGGRQDTGTEAQTPSMLPSPNKHGRNQQRSAQLLRTCRTILAEAAPVLYNHTIFQTTFDAFAGRLPVCMTDGNPSFPAVRHLAWHLHCDLLKKYDSTEVHIEPRDTQNLRSIQIVCQAETWRDTTCSEWFERDALIKGRQQVLDFAKALKAKMATGTKQFTLIEDTRLLPRGRVVLNIFQGRRIPAGDVCIFGLPQNLRS